MELEKAYEQQELARESIINLSRDIIRLSKKVITSVHNENISSAEEYWKELEEKVEKIKQENKLGSSGSYHIAMQEALEAKLLLHYAKNQEVLSFENAGFLADEYVAGMCDFIGELQRRAVLKISRGDTKSIAHIYKEVTQMYDLLLNFSLRGELRKKFDGVKYVMMKMEDLLLQLKLKSI